MNPIIFLVLAVTLIAKADESVQDSRASPSDDSTVLVNHDKKQEKRGIVYGSSGIDGVYGGPGYLGYNDGIGGYNPVIGNTPYTPYNTLKVAGLGAYNSPGYNVPYSTGYNGPYSTGYTNYNDCAGYPLAYRNSAQCYPYYRQSHYNSYPSSYYNRYYGSNIIGGGLGVALPTPISTPLSGGYQYGPGISGAIY